MRSRRGALWLLSSSLLGSGCSPLRFIPPGEQLIAREPILRGHVLPEVPPLYVRSNSRMMGMRVALQLYWAGTLLEKSQSQPWQTLRRIPKLRYYLYAFSQALQNKLGEPPALLSQRDIEKDVALLEEAYIQEGYFRVAIQPQVRPLREGEAQVIYRIRPGPRWYIRELDVTGEDSVLVSLAEAYLRHQLLPVGEPYRLQRLDPLREELHALFLAQGYHGLPLSALVWEVDTTQEGRLIERPRSFLRRWRGSGLADKPTCVVRLVLTEEAKRYVHGRIEVVMHTPDAESTQERNFGSVRLRTEPRADAILDGRVLIGRLYYPQGLYYDQKAISTSQRSLQGIETVQWVGPSLLPSEGETLHVRYDVVLRPPLDVGIGIEGFQSTQPLVGSLPLPGASINARLAHLSLLRRGWACRGRAQFALSYFRRQPNEPPLPLYNVVGELSFTFPEHTFYLREARPRPLPFTLSQQQHNLLLSYQDIRQMDFSRRYANLSWSRQTRYLFQDKRQEEQLWTPLGLTLVESRFSAAFEAQIEGLSPLVRSLILRDYLPRLTQITAWQVSTHRNYFSSSRGSGDFSSLLIELGGWVPFLAEHFLALALPQIDSTYRDNLFLNRFRYGVFVRLLSEGRWRQMLLSPNQQLYLRGRLGWGQGLYYTLDLPFENRFFVGGPNSMRAWQFGALGPGSYTFPQNLFLIPGGAFLLEVNTELRQHLYRGIQIATFLDVGNVWFLTSTLFEDRRGLLRYNPLPGVAGGVGLRWDFSVLVIRVDIAQQLFDPGTGWIFRQFPIGGTRSQYIFAVGHPF
ncbi:MAG: BamA/TamA family outer membrane protein [Bacteroidia bacterium]|nr:sorting and assembly machinery component 50 [Bacteroidia bacterium]MDW8015196.1 BamA/TamA family outer membrane protein [Bacteroidia bacterium]